MRGVVPEHLRNRFDVLDRMAPTNPPAPWRRVTLLSMGGLTDVGFANSSDLLLVISSAGRSVVDGAKGVVVARDDEDDFEFDAGNLLAEGIGPLEGVMVRTGGMRGGGLSARTPDGWGLEHHPLSWPDDELFLSPPGQTMLWTAPGQPVSLTKFAGFASEIRAFGFSPTGRCFALATASDVTIYGR